MNHHTCGENPLSDDELARIADETFLELDRREADAEIREQQIGAEDGPAR